MSTKPLGEEIHYCWSESLLRASAIWTKLFFKREPNNSKDPNAIVVCTYSREIIGHLTKDDAAFYSRFLNFDTCVFGALTRSAHGFYKTSMLVEKIIESSKYVIFHQ